MAYAILNIGYLIGKSKKRLHTRRIHNAVKKTGVKIIKSEMRKEDPSNPYDEDTRVIKIDRPLTKKEMIKLCTSLGQIAIPQMSGETGTLWGPKQVLIDRNYDGGKFNIDYFKLFSSEDAESFGAESKDYKKAYDRLKGALYDEWKYRDIEDSCNCEYNIDKKLESGEITMEEAESDTPQCQYCEVMDVFDEYGAESFDAESKCACGCSIGKCGCPEGCKCGCNHKKGGAKWAQAESFDANWGGMSLTSNLDEMSNTPGHPLNPTRPSDDRGDRLRPRRPIRRPRRRPYNAEVFGQDIDNKTIGVVALAAIIGGWLFNRGKD